MGLDSPDTFYDVCWIFYLVVTDDHTICLFLVNCCVINNGIMGDKWTRTYVISDLDLLVLKFFILSCLLCWLFEIFI